MINNEIREVLQKVCSILNKYNVEYIIIGGVAVGYYGYQRISGGSHYKPEIKTDVDFWYNPTNANYINLVNALGDIGVHTTELKELIFDPKRTFLKIPHKDFNTDFLPQMMGLSSFQESKRNAKKELLDGNEIFFIGYSDLMINKNAVNREIDKSDLEALEKMRKEDK